jgi:hypothetical protein
MKTAQDLQDRANLFDDILREYGKNKTVPVASVGTLLRLAVSLELHEELAEAANLPVEAVRKWSRGDIPFAPDPYRMKESSSMMFGTMMGLLERIRRKVVESGTREVRAA